MSSVSEPEVQFAQRLASNEKPVRRKALKKLKSYIRARSLTETGFSEEELLKLWKGLFYCLWMQDKPLLQEELSTQISGLVNQFHNFSAQLMYLQSFLTTVQREWTGIDRLRMDKFFQLVRFMFRQMFEVLKQCQWEPGCVRLFLELLASALLQTGASPVGLQMHVLDLYLSELAVVGAQELTADQNLIFIEPFCKAAAKTKDRSLFRAICNNIFSTIIDQAPFAIQELMKELQEDSGQASDDPEEPERELKSKSTKNNNNVKTTKNINGHKAQEKEEDDDGDDDEDDEEDDDGLSDTEPLFDEDVGPVLQFDYGAVADKLLQLSSRHNTPTRNRQRLYKIIKVLRDLSQGTFPQDEYPEEVSTDEDDDNFGSRKRMKKRHTEEEEQPEVKRAKGNDESKTLPPNLEQNREASSEKVKKQKKKKKKPQNQTEAADITNGMLKEPQSQVQPEPLEPSLQSAHTETASKVTAKKRKKKTKKTKGAEGQLHKSTEDNVSPPTEPSLSPSETLSSTQELSVRPVNEKEEAENTAQQKTSKTKTSPVEPDVTEHGSQHQESSTDNLKTPETKAKRPKKQKMAEQDKSKLTHELEEDSGNETKKDQNKALDIVPKSGEEQETLQNSETSETKLKTPKKQKKAGQKKSALKLELEDVSEPERNEDQNKTLDNVPKEQEAPQDSETTETNVKTPKKQKKAGQKKSALNTELEDVSTLEKTEDENKSLDNVPKEQEAPQDSETTEINVKPPKKQKKAEQKKSALKPELEDVSEHEKKDQNKTLDNVPKEQEADSETTETNVKTPKKQKVSRQKKRTPQPWPKEGAETKKKRKIPIEFEYEADEVQAEQAIPDTLADSQSPVSTPLQSKKKKTSDFVSFQSSSPPAPLFCRPKGPHTPQSKTTKSVTPKSESKKVRFGLKNNQTAEFRKSDRSLLLSPEGTSRVPFDPKQKPKCGVLKSPPTPHPKQKKKKTATLAKIQKKKPTRPSAADFF